MADLSGHSDGADGSLFDAQVTAPTVLKVGTLTKGPTLINSHNPILLVWMLWSAPDREAQSKQFR